MPSTFDDIHFLAVTLNFRAKDREGSRDESAVDDGDEITHWQVQNTKDFRILSTPSETNSSKPPAK